MEANELGDEIWTAYRANSTNNLGDESATTMGTAYSGLFGGKGCHVPVIWDSGCSKSIVSEEVVRTLGAQMNELDKSLKMASGGSLHILGTSDVFIKTLVTCKKKKLLHCTVLRGNKQSPEILVSLENMKRLGIVHPTFGRQTIDQFSSKYSERYQANSIQYYQPTKSDIKEPSKEDKELCEKRIGKF